MGWSAAQTQHKKTNILRVKSCWVSNPTYACLRKDGKAKVAVNDTVGYVNGNPSRAVNVYQGKPKDGLSPIHASPGTER